MQKLQNSLKATIENRKRHHTFYLFLTVRAVDQSPRHHQEVVHQTAVVRDPHGLGVLAPVGPLAVRAGVAVAPGTGKSQRGRLHYVTFS